jgi:hypothetical protein
MPSETTRAWFWIPKLSYPDCWLLWLPPTSKPCMRTPGASDSAPHTSVEFGTAISSSPLRLVPILVVEVSTSGESPVTVTLSVMPPTSSVAS